MKVNYIRKQDFLKVLEPKHYIVFVWKHLFFSNTHNDNVNQVYDNTMQIKFLTTPLQCRETQNPYALPGLEPVIFYYGGGRDDHYATPPGLQ
jgi:hypothetical protein